MGELRRRLTSSSAASIYYSAGCRRAIRRIPAAAADRLRVVRFNNRTSTHFSRCLMAWLSAEGVMRNAWATLVKLP